MRRNSRSARLPELTDIPSLEKAREVYRALPDAFPDVLTVDEPLPGRQDLERILFELHRSNGLGVPDTETVKAGLMRSLG